MTSDAKPQYSELTSGTSGTSAGAARARFTERRSSPRYNIVVDFELFHLWGAHRLIWAGTGKTRNWSRNSILIDWDKPLPEGTSVELVARWRPGVQLVVVGRVLQTTERGTVVRILRRRFRGKPEMSEVPRDARTRPVSQEPERAN